MIILDIDMKFEGGRMRCSITNKTPLTFSKDIILKTLTWEMQEKLIYVGILSPIIFLNSKKRHDLFLVLKFSIPLTHLKEKVKDRQILIYFLQIKYWHNYFSCSCNVNIFFNGF